MSDQSLPTEYAKDFLGLSLQEKPNKYYFIIRTSQLVVEADSSILTIMEKLQSYKNRVSLNFEVFAFIFHILKYVCLLLDLSFLLIFFACFVGIAVSNWWFSTQGRKDSLFQLRELKRNNDGGMVLVLFYELVLIM